MLVRAVTFSRGLSIALCWINLVFIPTFGMPFTVQQLHQWRPLCRSSPIPSKVRDRILELGCGRLTRCGCRAGARSREHCERTVNINIIQRSAVRSPSSAVQYIPVVTGNCLPVANGGITARRDDHVSVLRPVKLVALTPPVIFGVFNACSVSNKSASISHWIAASNLRLAAIVETWHDSLIIIIIIIIIIGFSV